MADDEQLAVNARFPRTLIERMDAYAELLASRTPGMKFTRSDVLRIAVEELTRDLVKPVPAKKVSGGRR